MNAKYSVATATTTAQFARKDRAVKFGQDSGQSYTVTSPSGKVVEQVTVEVQHATHPALLLNDKWSNDDLALVETLAAGADDIKVTKATVRLINGGKTIAWINRNRIDFPGTAPSVKFSTSPRRAA